ncbi:MAG TPA: hypothetical protein VEI49_11375, partial [Terriglobales bacterium]|nr:hypothetical protein [Terriglobales bacterium]
MSLLQNPWPEPGDTSPEVLPPIRPRVPEDPPWNGFDVLTIVGVAVISLVILPLIVVVFAHALVFPKLSLNEIVQVPEVVLAAQVLIYTVVFALMFRLMRLHTGQFWAPLRWSWPASWAGFLVLGGLLYFALMGLGQLLPIPKHLPIDRFFQTSREAAMMSVL